MNTASRQRNVSNTLLSPPQIVSAIRLTFILSALLGFQRSPVLCVFLVAIAELMDMLDGYLARKYNAVSAFGAIVDMVIDRLTPIFCFTALISLLPAYTGLFSVLLALDLLGHMAMLYCAILQKDIQHHKNLFVGVHWLLDLYYAKAGHKKSFMVLTIVFYDIALLAGLLHLVAPQLMPMVILIPALVLGSIKVYVHLLHLYFSFKLSL